MHRSLEQARAFANTIKFSGDRSISFTKQPKEYTDSLKGQFYSNELLISKNITPELYKALSNVMERLCVPEEAVTAFVYASPEINANCFLGLNDECVLRFSSGLIDILSNAEFEFVVGHEMGHFLCDHPPICNTVNDRSLEDLIQQRSQEISADRIGLICSETLDVAVKALIKTASGLTDKYLRFDVGSYLSQLQRVSSSMEQNIASSHPSVLIRCRALLWFSLNQSYMYKKNFVKEELLKLDKKISSDLDRYVNSSAKKIIDAAKETLAVWMAAFEIVQKDRFSKNDQQIFSERFGHDVLNSFLNFLDNVNKENVEKAIFENIQQARHELEVLIPASFEEEVSKINFII